VLRDFAHEIGHYYGAAGCGGSLARAVSPRAVGRRAGGHGAAWRRTMRRVRGQHWFARFVSAYAGMHPWEDRGMGGDHWAHYRKSSTRLETRDPPWSARQPGAGRDAALAMRRVDLWKERLRRPGRAWCRSHTPQKSQPSHGPGRLYRSSLVPPVMRRLRFITTSSDAEASANRVTPCLAR